MLKFCRELISFYSHWFMCVLTHGCRNDWQWKIIVVEDIGDKQEVHIAAMGRH